MQYTLRLTDYWLTVWRRTWWGTAVTSFLMPFLYLTAMGVGLGGFVDNSAGTRSLGGLSYLDFIGPGLLAATSMLTAVSEATYPVMAGFKWQKFYFSMSATPLRASDIVAGQLGFVAARILTTCGVFLVVLACFGAVHGVLGALGALAVALVLGLSYAGPICGISSRMKTESGFSLIYRLGLMPMFLFSGAFFPISQLPEVVQWLAKATPIWHGVELSRMLTVGTVEAGPAMVHLAYLLLWVVVGWFYAVRGFARRLEQ